MEFKLNTDEKREYLKFYQDHKDCKFSSTTGGKITFIITPTSLGNCIIVRCNVCGKEKDITDINNW